ncbi:MAG: GNAT family N-acetyltransferase [Kofleriaceae bacterium]
MAAARERGLTLTSFLALLGEQFLANRHSLVVTGTHGKTTTTAMLGHVLAVAGRDPSLLVGGVPIELGHGYRPAPATTSWSRASEYDTAFFDKGSKFLHYRPQTAILTSLELDHVDIFSSLEAIREAFRRFVALLPEHGTLIVCADAPDAVAVAQTAVPGRALRGRARRHRRHRAGAGRRHLVGHRARGRQGRPGRVRRLPRPERLDRFETLLVGRHNVGNCLALDRGLPRARGGAARCAPPRHRQLRPRSAADRSCVASPPGSTCSTTTPTTPTAVRETLRGLRQRFAKRRLIAVYDPRSATSRRKTFQAEFAAALALADEVVIGKLFDPSKIPVEERFDPEQLARDLHRSGTKATYLPEVDAIVSHLADSAGPGDVVVVLSSGSFDGLHDKLLDAIGDPIRPARRADMAAVQVVLREGNQPVDDAGEADAPSFFQLSNEEGVCGCVALDVLGDDAILRSLAVRGPQRGGGYGWMLADMAVAHARHRGVRRIYLLTETASDFFAAKFGFRVIDRSTVSAAVGATPTFRRSTDARMVAMRLDL